MELTAVELGRRARPAGGWPRWAIETLCVAAEHPQAQTAPSSEYGANCQSYAYGVLGLFGRHVPRHRSSELWEDEHFAHLHPGEAQNLDLVLFSATGEAWGAHVAVVLGEGLLHLCAEVGVPAIWRWQDFAERGRYGQVAGVVRVPPVAKPARAPESALGPSEPT